MSYAIRKDGAAWRAVSGPDDIGPDEDFSATQPVLQPTIAQIVGDFTSQIQKRLDEFARTRNYDGILSACTYATSSVPRFQAEGQYCVGARDSTWAAAYQILDQALAGNWPTEGAGQIPANIADIEGSLPALAWPTPA